MISYNQRILVRTINILAFAITQNPIKQDSFFEIQEIDIGKKIEINIRDFNNKIQSWISLLFLKIMNLIIELLLWKI